MGHCVSTLSAMYLEHWQRPWCEVWCWLCPPCLADFNVSWVYIWATNKVLCLKPGTFILIQVNKTLPMSKCLGPQNWITVTSHHSWFPYWVLLLVLCTALSPWNILSVWPIYDVLVACLLTPGWRSSLPLLVYSWVPGVQEESAEWMRCQPFPSGSCFSPLSVHILCTRRKHKIYS